MPIQNFVMLLLMCWWCRGKHLQKLCDSWQLGNSWQQSGKRLELFGQSLDSAFHFSLLLCSYFGIDTQYSGLARSWECFDNVLYFLVIFFCRYIETRRPASSKSAASSTHQGFIKDLQGFRLWRKGIIRMSMIVIVFWSGVIWERARMGLDNITFLWLLPFSPSWI